jgi:NADPH:quinone reductase-like Zn-dependent oxidoreductase
MDITGGRGVDVVLDLVGGPYLADNVRALATGGRIVTVGVTGGRSADLDLRGLMARRGSITGTVLRARPLEEKGALANEFSRRVVRGFETEDLKPVIDHIFPAEDAAESHRRMESNVNFGKILLSW